MTLEHLLLVKAIYLLIFSQRVKKTKNENIPKAKSAFLSFGNFFSLLFYRSRNLFFGQLVCSNGVHKCRQFIFVRFLVGFCDRCVWSWF